MNNVKEQCYEADITTKLTTTGETRYVYETAHCNNAL